MKKSKLRKEDSFISSVRSVLLFIFNPCTFLTRDGVGGQVGDNLRLPKKSK